MQRTLSTNSLSHTETHTQTHAHKHTLTHIYTHTVTHTCTHTLTHAHKRTDMYTYTTQSKTNLDSKGTKETNYFQHDPHSK